MKSTKETKENSNVGLQILHGAFCQKSHRNLHQDVDFVAPRGTSHINASFQRKHITAPFKKRLEIEGVIHPDDLVSSTSKKKKTQLDAPNIYQNNKQWDSSMNECQNGSFLNFGEPQFPGTSYAENFHQDNTNNFFWDTTESCQSPYFNPEPPGAGNNSSYAHEPPSTPNLSNHNGNENNTSYYFNDYKPSAYVTDYNATSHMSDRSPSFYVNKHNPSPHVNDYNPSAYVTDYNTTSHMSDRSPSFSVNKHDPSPYVNDYNPSAYENENFVPYGGNAHDSNPQSFPVTSHQLWATPYSKVQIENSSSQNLSIGALKDKFSFKPSVPSMQRKSTERDFSFEKSCHNCAKQKENCHNFGNDIFSTIPETPFLRIVQSEEAWKSSAGLLHRNTIEQEFVLNIKNQNIQKNIPLNSKEFERLRF